MRGRRGAAPLELRSAELDGVRTALTPPGVRRLRIRWVLVSAVLMTTAALALCATVMLGVGSPPPTAASAAVRAPLTPPP